LNDEHLFVLCVQKMLVFKPGRRISSRDALNHPYLRDDLDSIRTSSSLSASENDSFSDGRSDTPVSKWIGVRTSRNCQTLLGHPLGHGSQQIIGAQRYRNSSNSLSLCPKMTLSPTAIQTPQSASDGRAYTSWNWYSSLCVRLKMTLGWPLGHNIQQVIGVRTDLWIRQTLSVHHQVTCARADRPGNCFQHWPDKLSFCVCVCVYKTTCLD
jgi:hypothetical protein